VRREGPAWGGVTTGVARPGNSAMAGARQGRPVAAHRAGRRARRGDSGAGRQPGGRGPPSVEEERAVRGSAGEVGGDQPARERGGRRPGGRGRSLAAVAVGYRQWGGSGERRITVGRGAVGRTPCVGAQGRSTATGQRGVGAAGDWRLSLAAVALVPS
jgi:hypothetical protein